MLKVHLQNHTLNYKLFHESTKNKTQKNSLGEGEKGREGSEGKGEKER